MGATDTLQSSGIADLSAELLALPGFSMADVFAGFLWVTGRFGFAAATKFGQRCSSQRTGATSRVCLPNFGNNPYDTSMTTMNISLPDSLKDFVDEQVEQRGYGTSSEYVRELIRKEQDRLQLRGLLLEGASSAPTKPVDDAYFDGLRRRVKVSKSSSRR